jgi:hypothetical protein
MSEMRLTTIIPWCQRPELEGTLRLNAPFFAAMRSQIIVVNCGGDSETLRQLLASDGLPPTRQVDLPAPRFSVSLARNIGVSEADNGVVFMLDGDILLTSNLRPYAEACARQDRFVILSGMTLVPRRPPPFEAPAGSALTKIVFESSQTYYWADGRVTRILRNRVDQMNGRRLAPGIMIARRQHVIDAGGYSSDLVGWGWEDLDIQVRLFRLGLECTYVDEEIKHLEHGDDKRDLDAPKREVDDANRARVWRNYAAGRISGTYHADVETWRARLSRPAAHPPRALASAFETLTTFRP